jgi:hypothetical protein
MFGTCVMQSLAIGVAAISLDPLYAQTQHAENRDAPVRRW